MWILSVYRELATSVRTGGDASVVVPHSAVQGLQAELQINLRRIWADALGFRV